MFRLTELPAELGGGVYWPRGRRAAIIIDRSLTQAERYGALVHELVHDELGGGIDLEGAPEAMGVFEDRLERRVENEAARRAVPLDRLAELVDALATLELPVEVWDVAQQFDVPEPMARRALELLRHA